MSTSAFAAFLVLPYQGQVAATSRAADRGEAGRIGLPGGRIDSGETPEQAARREAREEGWFLPAETPLREVWRAIVDGREVVWLAIDWGREDADYCASRIFPLDRYAEQGRITPIAVPLADIASSGYGNEFLAHWAWVDGRLGDPTDRMRWAVAKHYRAPRVPVRALNVEADCDVSGRCPPKWARKAIADYHCDVAAAEESAQEAFLETDEGAEAVAAIGRYAALRHAAGLHGRPLQEVQA